jgi:large subunit ribosomal protein L30
LVGSASEHAEVANVFPVTAWTTSQPSTKGKVLAKERYFVQYSNERIGHWLSNCRTMSYFRITLVRSGIGLPKRTQGVLKALGLRQRMKTVFYPVTPEVAGQIMRVKELVAVREVDRPLTKEELKAERRPDPGFYLESAVPR